MLTRARIDGKQGDCPRVLFAGKAPLQAREHGGPGTVANRHLTQAVLSDMNGTAAAKPVEVKAASGQTIVAVPPTIFCLALCASAKAM